jgi:hypothetical protein
VKEWEGESQILIFNQKFKTDKTVPILGGGGGAGWEMSDLNKSSWDSVDE